MLDSIKTMRQVAEANLNTRFIDESAKLEQFVGNNEVILDMALALIGEVVEIEPYIDSTQELYVSFTGNGDQYAHVYRILRKAGYSPDRQISEGEESYFTTWWRKADAPILYVSFASNACRRVAVGTRQVTETVYETICDE